MHYYFQRFMNFLNLTYLLKEIHPTTFGVVMHRVGMRRDQVFKGIYSPNL